MTTGRTSLVVTRWDAVVTRWADSVMAEYQDLGGTSFVVTGANGGMGAAICVGLVGAGASVMASDLHDAPGVLRRDVAEALTYQRADVSDAEDVRRLIDAATEMSGRVDGAVTAAAIEFETVRRVRSPMQHCGCVPTTRCSRPGSPSPSKAPCCSGEPSGFS